MKNSWGKSWGQVIDDYEVDHENDGRSLQIVTRKMMMGFSSLIMVMMVQVIKNCDEEDVDRGQVIENEEYGVVFGWFLIVFGSLW